MTTTKTTAKALPVAVPTEGAIVLGRSKAHATIRTMIADYRTARTAAKTQDALGKHIKDILVSSNSRAIIDHGIHIAWLTDVTKEVVDIDSMRDAHPDIVSAYEAALAAFEMFAEPYTSRAYHYTKLEVVK